MSRRAWIITAAVVLVAVGGFVGVWLGSGSGDSGTTTVQLTSS